MGEQVAWTKSVSIRLRWLLALLNFSSVRGPRLSSPPPLDDLDPTRRVTAGGFTADSRHPEPRYWSGRVVWHRYDDSFTQPQSDILVRDAVWSVLFNYRPERKFLTLAGHVWALSPDEPSFERALLWFRFKQLEDKITDYGEYSIWEVVRQIPRAALRVLRS